MNIKKIDPIKMAHLKDIGCIDPITAAKYVRSVGIKKAQIFINESNRLFMIREKRRNNFILKQTSKNWLEKLLGL
ncbi:MAG: hypothetical protein KGI72_04970 [Patescibacteria group bacterium]|nr:hypothetical protein [Patescibacteria group bacterium]MDE2015845.1 hypothetical protein [Patescibacteria group bacterium]